METETSPPCIMCVVRTATSNLHIQLHFNYKFAILLLFLPPHSVMLYQVKVEGRIAKAQCTIPPSKMVVQYFFS